MYSSYAIRCFVEDSSIGFFCSSFVYLILVLFGCDFDNLMFFNGSDDYA